MPATESPLFLCAGLQSSGSTLVSWAFLQRKDMDGVLDARNDVLPTLPRISAPLLWCKTTISSFSLEEMIGHYADEGCNVRPLLVVRDVRAVFNSLIRKTYGSNGTSAEEPPLRMRLRRFKRDWEQLRDRCAIIRYESLVIDPEATLRQCCGDLGLEWDQAMIHWSKPVEAIADPGHGSPTFRRSRGGSFAETAKPELARVSTNSIPPADREWLESEFADFNRAMDYAAHIEGKPEAPADTRAIPRWENTRRYRKSQQTLERMKAKFVTLRNAIKKKVAPKPEQIRSQSIGQPLLRVLEFLTLTDELGLLFSGV